MKIDRAGVPFIAGAFGLAVILASFAFVGVAMLFAILTGFFLFFFRDPERSVPAQKSIIISPADGRVVHAGAAAQSVAPAGTWQQISVFLSPLDVHVNRVPVSGTVTRVMYRPGKFLPAYRSQAASDNERAEIWIEHNEHLVICRQVTGALARRVVCRLKPGMNVNLGQRFGIMKFGSRMDVFVPFMAVLQVKVGDIVRGGETVLAVFSEESSPENAITNE